MANCKKISKKLSNYEICPNDGRKNKISLTSSEFPRERWLFHNESDAKDYIIKTEKILAFRKLRDTKDNSVKLEMKKYRKELK